MPQDKSAVHSLPSFAQAFSSLNSDDNALPPIQRPSPITRTPGPQPHQRQERAPERRTPQSLAVNNARTRKRPRALSTASRDDDGYSSSDRGSSPRVNFIKEEQEFDQLEPTPPPPSIRTKTSAPRHETQANSITATSGAPAPSLLRPQQTSKRRRVTISGLNTTNLSTPPSSAPSGQTHAQPLLNVSTGPATAHPHTGPSTPISPVVMGFTIEPHNPQKIEQVRAMLNVKKRQKALIESRRGSTAGLGLTPSATPSANEPLGRRGSAAGMIEGRRGSVPSVNVVNSTPTSAGPPPPPTPTAHKRSGNSPNGGGRRIVGTGTLSTPVGLTSTPVPPVVRSTSPPTHIVPSQNPRPQPRTPPQVPHTAAVHGPGQNANQIQNQTQSHPPPQTAPVQSQNQAQAQLATQGLTALANALPPPPTSFARRRAGQLGMRNKPADIVISPRDADPDNGIPSVPNAAARAPALRPFNYKSLQPAVQSAPPIPRFGEQPGRFPMALPSLPPAISQQGVSIRKTAVQVPPTPTRLGMQRSTSGTGTASVRLSQPTGVPGTGVPPQTPATLHRAAHTPADKAAFLAPFEAFYDALGDAQVLKGWFGEQLGRVGRVVRELEGQKAELEKSRAELERQRAEVEKLVGGPVGVRGEVESWVSDAVAREVGAWRDEVGWLRQRVGQLEEVLQGKRDSGDVENDPKGKGKAPGRSVNGLQSQRTYLIAPDVETYKFPPEPQQIVIALPPPPTPLAKRRSSSPARLQASDSGPDRRSPSASRSQASSPAPSSFDYGQRMSVSAIRCEPQQPQPTPPSKAGTGDNGNGNGNTNAKAAEKVAGPGRGMHPPAATTSGSLEQSTNGQDTEGERPGSRRFNSHNGVSNPGVNGRGKASGGGANNRRGSTASPPTRSQQTDSLVAIDQS